jgi:hypothetical protein
VEEKSTGIKKIYKSLPLYGAINGFSIDTEGEYVINIKYAAQEIFHIGALISALSFVFVVLYLIRGHRLIFPRSSNNLQ